MTDHWRVQARYRKYWPASQCATESEQRFNKDLECTWPRSVQVCCLPCQTQPAFVHIGDKPVATGLWGTTCLLTFPWGTSCRRAAASEHVTTFAASKARTYATGTNNIHNTVYLSYSDCTAIGNYIPIVTSMLNGISTPSEN